MLRIRCADDLLPHSCDAHLVHILMCTQIISHEPQTLGRLLNGWLIPQPSDTMKLSLFFTAFLPAALAANSFAGANVRFVPSPCRNTDCLFPELLHICTPDGRQDRDLEWHAGCRDESTPPDSAHYSPIQCDPRSSAPGSPVSARVRKLATISPVSGAQLFQYGFWL